MAIGDIGAAFAERLARDRPDLIVVARRRDRLEALAQRLGKNHTAEALIRLQVTAELHQRMGMDLERFPAAMGMKPEQMVDASLAGLPLGEVTCMPALDDPAFLTQLQESERRLLERSNGGTPARATGREADEAPERTGAEPFGESFSEELKRITCIQ